MKLFKTKTKFDFLGMRRISTIASLSLMAVSIVSLSVFGLQLGLDFTGGTLIELGYKQSVNLTEVRGLLEKNGYDDAIVQHFGTTHDILIRIAPKKDVNSAHLSETVMDILRKPSNQQVVEGGSNTAQTCLVASSGEVVDCDLQVRRIEFVGPQVGEELTEQGGLAMLIALIGIFIYVFFRFEYRFALGSIVAIVHDVIITLGVFSLFRIGFDLTVLAAILAVIGYSLNDTIVVYDRIRENFRKMRKGTPFEIINTSLNQTLSRTLMTSFTTMLVLGALFIFGGEIIRNFSLALIIGVIVGTYSSIYVASVTVLALGISKTDLMIEKKDGAPIDDLP